MTETLPTLRDIVRDAPNDEALLRGVNLLRGTSAVCGNAVSASINTAWQGHPPRPMVLNTATHSVDLRMGLCVAPAADVYHYRAPVAYRPDAVCPAWEAFVARAMSPQPVFVRKLLGSLLVADESSAVYLTGPGAPSVLGVIEALLGPQYVTYHEDIDGRNRAVAVRGRVVWCVTDGLRVLTGRSDRGVPGRLRSGHATVVHVDRADLFNLFTAPVVIEADGILAWLVRGAVAWLREDEELRLTCPMDGARAWALVARSTHNGGSF